MWPPQRSIMWPGQPPHQHNLLQQQQQQQHHPPLQHGPQRVPHPYYGAHAQLLPDPGWPPEYHLEQQFSQMSFRQPPPQVYQQQQPHGSTIRQQQPPLPNGRLNCGNPGIPSLMDIRVPRPPHLNYTQRPPPPAPRPGKWINTSVPPPRITLLQRQPQQPQSSSPTTATMTTTRSSSIAACTPPSVVIAAGSAEAPSNLNGHVEDVIREPELRVTTILKRPASTPSNLSLSGDNGHNDNGEDSNAEINDPVKNLKKREEEYAKVRLRILGSTGVDEENTTSS